MGKILATDLDGTLFYPKQFKRCIPIKNTKFLREWIDAGNKLVLVTSRSYQFTEKLKLEIDRPVDFIACTSSQIVVDGELVRDEFIDPVGLKDVIKHLDEVATPVAYLMTTKDYPLVIKNNKNLSGIFSLIYKLWYKLQFKYREEYIMDNKIFDEQLEKGQVYKVMVFYGFGKSKKELSKDINKFLREKYPTIESSWSSIVNELTPINCNKGSGIEYYADYLKIDHNDIIVVGDSGNDITMFNKFHENSYCMTHAPESVKKYAKHTVKKIYKLKEMILEGENHEQK